MIFFSLFILHELQAIYSVAICLQRTLKRHTTHTHSHAHVLCTSIWLHLSGGPFHVTNMYILQLCTRTSIYRVECSIHRGNKQNKKRNVTQSCFDVLEQSEIICIKWPGIRLRHCHRLMDINNGNLSEKNAHEMRAQTKWMFANDD